MNNNTVIIACSIFKTELEHLKEIGKINIPIVYLNSMLHMEPQKLKVLLDEKIKENNHLKIILAFGDCHARMIDYEENKNIVRTPGINCCEIFLGTPEYRELRKQGSFILLPEWAERWKEVFQEYMGFKNSKSTAEFMNEMHKKLVYVDTGYKTMNNNILKEISEFTGLPLEIHKSSIVELEKTITKLMDCCQLK